jgi:hypothetical protein
VLNIAFCFIIYSSDIVVFLEMKRLALLGPMSRDEMIFSTGGWPEITAV